MQFVLVIMDEIKIPDLPEYFDQYATSLWRRSIKNLEKMGTLHTADFDLLAQYCFALSICHKLAPDIRKEGPVIEYTNNDGHTNKVINPSLKVYNENLAITTRIAQYFGFTPASRKKIGSKEIKKVDKFNDI